MSGGLNQYVAILLMASFYEMWAAGTLCDTMGSDNCKEEYAWALAVGVISFAICLIMTVSAATSCVVVVTGCTNQTATL